MVAAVSRLSAGDFYPAVIRPRLLCAEQRKLKPPADIRIEWRDRLIWGSRSNVLTQTLYARLFVGGLPKW